MSSAVVTVSVATSPAVTAGPPVEAPPAPTDPGEADQAQSFTDVLSAQGGGSRRHLAGHEHDGVAEQKEPGGPPDPGEGGTPRPTAAGAIGVAPSSAAAPPPEPMAALVPPPPQPPLVPAPAAAAGDADSGPDDAGSEAVHPTGVPSGSPGPSAAPAGSAPIPTFEADPAGPDEPAQGRRESTPPLDPTPGSDLPPGAAVAAPPATDSPATLVGPRSLRAAMNVTGQPVADRPEAPAASSETSAHAAPATAEAAVTPSPVAAGHGQVTSGPLDMATAVHTAGSISRAAPVASPAAPFSEPASNPLDVEGLSGSITRPLSDGNGTYTVTVAMHPAELGHLQAVMSLDGNDLQVSITAQTQKGHEALSVAADALKNQLARGGVNVNVTLRDPGSPSQGDDRRRGAAPAGGLAGPEEAAPTASPALVVPSGQIHLVL